MNAPVPVQSASCPLPLRDYPQIVMGHGGGGKLSAELIEHVFLPAFGLTNQLLSDSTPLTLPGHRIAVSTDSFVVRPLFFPGGSIGDLAVNGTVNDLAMSGAMPKYLTVGFILEEGLEIEVLARIAMDMARAARDAGVCIVAGDTKVVERGRGDGCYINTTGIGLLPPDCSISIDQARCGDAVLISGTIADHAMAIMSVRDGLEFEAPIRSDTVSVSSMVHALIKECPNVRCLRDPTRGGLATTMNEIAAASRCGIELVESDIPVDPVVRSACEFWVSIPCSLPMKASSLQLCLERTRNEPLRRSARILSVAEPRLLVVSWKILTISLSQRHFLVPIGSFRCR
jgi:hydrogenase expression/formation protein HypE